MNDDKRPSQPPPLDAHPRSGQPEGPPPGVRTMALLRWLLVGLMAFVAAASVVYSFGLLPGGTANAAPGQYYCPMHPQIVQDGPGECPICSMSLVLKEGGTSKPKGNTAAPPAAGAGAEPAGSHAGHRHNPSDPFFCPMHPEETGLDASARCPICEMKMEPRPRAAPNAPQDSMEPGAAAAPSSLGVEEHGVPGLVPVELSLERQQLIGVRTMPATAESLVPELRTVAFVSADEARLARVHTRFSGWIEHLAVATTGQDVRQGQVLASIYNLELLPAQQEFLTALRWGKGGEASASAAKSAFGNQLEQDARTRLELLGMSPGEIDRIAATSKVTRTIDVTAPIAGSVVQKAATQGLYVQPGTTLFEIADLSKVWALADVYEYEIARVRLGQSASLGLAAYPGLRFPGKVAFIYPALDADTRTLRFRLEFDNRRRQLRPGMYGDVVIQVEAALGVVVPREALVDTGEHQYVFVAKDAGRFEPRRVTAGARSGEKVQVLEGLAAGERVVTTANFLIDSESRLRAAIEGGPDSTSTPAVASTCDTDFDAAQYPDKHSECRQCERVHRGMGTMEDDCKNAIPKPWR